MPSQPVALNDEFGARLTDGSAADLRNEAFQREAYDLWARCGGLLALAGRRRGGVGQPQHDSRGDRL